MEAMMRRIGFGLLALALQAFAPGAAAQEAYGTGGAGRSSWAFDCGAGGCQRNTTAWRVAAGYRFNRVVALEAFYMDLGRARSSDFSLDGRLGATGAGAQALIGWQFGNVDLAGKIGLAGMRNDFRASPTSLYSSSTARHTELIGGLMGAYRITPNVALRMDVDIVTVALEGDFLFYSRGSDVTTLMLGMMVRF
jgi:hypothetical protein